MSLSAADTARRFEGLAEGYAKYRPDYPASAVEFIITRAGLQAGESFVDVGCGTGIATRLFTARGFNGIGIEPNDDMRRAAQGVPDRHALYLPGTAAATDLPDASTRLVLAAQAFHWFPHEESLREFHRILVPGGSVALMWYEQDTTDPLTADYVAAHVAHSPEPKIAAWKQSETGEILLTSPLFERAERRDFRHEQRLDWPQMLGRAFTASYAPRDLNGRRRLEEAMHAAFNAHQQDGYVVMKYDIVVYIATKPLAASQA